MLAEINQCFCMRLIIWCTLWCKHTGVSLLPPVKQLIDNMQHVMSLLQILTMFCQTQYLCYRCWTITFINLFMLRKDRKKERFGWPRLSLFVFLPDDVQRSCFKRFPRCVQGVSVFLLLPPSFPPRRWAELQAASVARF